VLASTMSGILKYFKRTNDTTLTLKAREMAEKEVKKLEEAVAEVARTGIKRGHYDFLSDENKAKVAKYALQHGVTSSLQHFKRTKEFPNLKESTLRGWANKLKGDIHSVAQGKSDADKSKLCEHICSKKNREATSCWRGCGELNSRIYQGIQGFCMCY